MNNILENRLSVTLSEIPIKNNFSIKCISCGVLDRNRLLLKLVEWRYAEDWRSRGADFASNVWWRLTLTADDLDSHAGMSMPLDRVELDVASQHSVVQVVVLHGERVHVTVEHLAVGNHRNTDKYEGNGHCEATVAPELYHAISCNRQQYQNQICLCPQTWCSRLCYTRMQLVEVALRGLYM